MEQVCYDEGNPWRATANSNRWLRRVLYESSLRAGVVCDHPRGQGVVDRIEALKVTIPSQTQGGLVGKARGLSSAAVLVMVAEPDMNEVSFPLDLHACRPAQRLLSVGINLIRLSWVVAHWKGQTIGWAVI